MLVYVWARMKNNVSDWVPFLSSLLLFGGSPADLGPVGLVSNRSGFNVYWRDVSLSSENCISFVFNEAVWLARHFLSRRNSAKVKTQTHRRQHPKAEVGDSAWNSLAFGGGLTLIDRNDITINIVIANIMLLCGWNDVTVGSGIKTGFIWM